MASDQNNFQYVAGLAELDALLAAMSQFASAANHDLNAPLRHIQMFAELIRRDHGEVLTDGAGEYLERIFGAVSKSEQLVHALVDFARTASAPLQPVRLELGDVAGRVAHTFMEKLDAVGGALEIEALPPAMADAQLVQRSLSELIDNAIKFGGPNPHIRIMARPSPGPGFVCIGVGDAGPGLLEGQSEAAFELLRRLHSDISIGGNGMGLALCRLIIERHGGKAWHNADHAPGAAFDFSLPAPA
jgi:light-regulated signal transduction histidine kinase (bacteriophytochrome)